MTSGKVRKSPEESDKIRSPEGQSVGKGCGTGLLFPAEAMPPS